ncbi:uncharacterized protein LOC129581543 [Paramacrobiotus metropolitanus]|uniref:uncharacterized protein LOC129581543 n=1 Tax=Paramacrobiotus metropolitanus TaxID=2943436 RepID=UPI0024464659|nr:uncharacterized protein LOC129581543 [Paramacrobiotus metropolitanus]
MLASGWISALLGTRLLSQFFLILCLIFSLVALTHGTWYCKNRECTEPVFEGRTTHDYEPPPDAIKNGYIAAPAHQDSIIYRLSQEPFIVDAEINGKRGLLPRAIIAITKDHMGDKNYETIEAPPAPYEVDPYTEKPVGDEEKTQPKPVDETVRESPAPVPENAVKEQIPVQPGDAGVDQPKSEDSPQNTKQVESNAVAGGSPKDESDSGTAAVKSDVEKVEAIPQKDSTAAESTANQPAEAKPQELGDKTDEPKEKKAADGTADQPLTNNIAKEEPRADADVTVNMVSEIAKEDKSAAIVAERTADLGRGTEQKSADVKPETPSGDSTPSNAVDPIQAQNVSGTDNAKTQAPEKPKEKIGESVPAEPPKPSGPTPDLTKQPALDETKKTLVVDPVMETSTVAPTASIKESPLPAATPAVPIQQPSTIPKMPEPKVTFQDPMRNNYGGMPQLDLDHPRPVFTTKVANRFHDHHHHHHHGAHDHSHDHHGHAHHHGHDHHGHHDHAHHDHEHDHDHHDHAHEKLEKKESGNVISEQPLSTSRDEKAVEEKVHHHHEEHSHSDKPKAADSVQSESAVGVANSAISPADLPVEQALLVNANFTFIPPEDATHAPVNYTQLVLDRMEGKTIPGFLNEALDKEPSEGYPVPPPLDPATATEAPRIPGLSDNALPATDMEAAVQSVDRYNKHGRARFINRGGRGVPAISEGSEEKQTSEENHNHDHDSHDHSHHDHHHDHHDDHGHHHHDHGLPPSTAPDTESVPAEEVVGGTCSARTGGGEGSCDDIEPLDVVEYEPGLSEPVKSSEDKPNEKSMLHGGMVVATKYWLLVVAEFEKVSASLRLIGMMIFAAAATVFLGVASRDRNIRKALERGFEEYDHKKDTELIVLREQVQKLVKEKQETERARSMILPIPPPGIIPKLPDGPPAPCLECSNLRNSAVGLKKTITENEQLLKDHRETHANLLSKNNEMMTEVVLIRKERDDLRRELDGTKSRLIEMERRPIGGAVTNGYDAAKEAELTSLRISLQQLQSENDALRTDIQSASSTDISSTKLAALQTERDEAASNVRLLKQLLGEKEEEIRKVRSTDGSGGVSARELQEKTDEARSYRKQVHRLQDEIETIKRERESQLQLRCQSFRIAADKAQRDALMARQETIVVRQQLEELCRKYGEQVPAVIIPQISNGAASPPGIATPPMMFGGMPYPPGPPPPTFEAFKQHVLSHSAGSSGYISPHSPGREQERDRVRERKVGKKNAQEYSRNGKDGYLDDSDTEREKKRDRSKR